MALFKYRATDNHENSVEGTIEESSAQRVVQNLQGQGLKVSSVDRVGPEPGIFPKRSTLTWKDLEQLNNQMAMIVRGSLPLAPSIAAMERDLHSPRLRAVLEQVRMDLESGKQLSDAFARHPNSFPPLYLALVRAGERTGNLSPIFMHLSDYSKSMLELKSRLQEILTYPIILLVTACVLMGFLLTKVVPVFAEIFKDFGGQLPAPTRLLVNMSDLLTYHLATIGASLAALVVVAFLLPFALGRIDSSGYVRDRLKSWIPVFGRFYVQASVVRFSRALRMMLEANIPILDSLELSAAASGNAVLARAIGETAHGIAGGASLADSLEKTRYFDSGFCWLLRNAEQRGELQSALFLLEDEYSRTLGHLRNVVLNMAGPTVVVAIGIMVGFIVLSLYLPIFSLGDVISGC